MKLDYPREVARGGQPLSRLFDLNLCGFEGRTKYHLRKLIYGVDPAVSNSTQARGRGADAHNKHHHHRQCAPFPAWRRTRG